jgi:hypothetical protein
MAFKLCGRELPLMLTQDFEYGTTEKLDHASISLRLQRHFMFARKTTDHPIILLVNDESATRHMLKYFGVDDSHFESGIENLLKLQESYFVCHASPFNTNHLLHRVFGITNRRHRPSDVLDLRRRAD